MRIPTIFSCSTLLLGAAALAGCASDGPDDLAEGRLAETVFSAGAIDKLDLLFVIDNSGSMCEEQASLRANLARYVTTLQNQMGFLPDLHIAVATTDLGTMGGHSLGGPGGCDGFGDGGALQSAGLTLAGGNFLSDVAAPDGTSRVRNYDGTLAEAFDLLADVGTSGCGFEAPLESMRRALDGSIPANAGLLRQDAPDREALQICDQTSPRSGAPRAPQGWPSRADAQKYLARRHARDHLRTSRPTRPPRGRSATSEVSFTEILRRALGSLRAPQRSGSRARRRSSPTPATTRRWRSARALAE